MMISIQGNYLVHFLKNIKIQNGASVHNLFMFILQRKKRMKEKNEEKENEERELKPVLSNVC